MPITEDQVREGILRALSAIKGGFMTTEDLIPALEADLKPTGVDLEILANRSDTRFTQKVRNPVSHRERRTSLESRGLALYVEENEGWQITDVGRAYVATRYPQA